MKQVPFTIKADIDLGGRVIPYMSETAPDVVIKEGKVPETLGPNATCKWAYDIDGDNFLVKTDCDLRLLIENGSKITYQRGASVSDREVMLFVLGSAWGALAYQRHLLPLHASAIMRDGHVYAFSGPAGAGKSTLTAALSQSELNFFCDDVLIIDPASLIKEARCYAGQKDLKLWGDALELTGLSGKGLIRDDPAYDKFYTDPKDYADKTTGLLTEIYMLEDGNANSTSIDPLRGGIAIKSLSDCIYRPYYAQDIVGFKTIFNWLGLLKDRVDLFTFKRSKDPEAFDRNINIMARHLARGELRDKDNDHGQ